MLLLDDRTPLVLRPAAEEGELAQREVPLAAVRAEIGYLQA